MPSGGWCSRQNLPVVGIVGGDGRVQAGRAGLTETGTGTLSGRLGREEQGLVHSVARLLTMLESRTVPDLKYLMGCLGARMYLGR